MEYTLVSEGNLVAAYYTTNATFENEHMGFAAHNGPVVVDGVNLYRFEDGKIVEAWFAFDTAGLMMQLMNSPGDE